MNLKRFFKVVLILVLGLAAIFGVAKIIYQHTSIDEKTIQENYEEHKKNCELLKTIANDCIEEGKEIKIEGLTNMDVTYKIVYNNGENIVFSYSVNDKRDREGTRYMAKITLSNDCKILMEEYSVEIEDYETYKESTQKLYILVSILCAMVIIWISIFVSEIIYKNWSEIRKRKKEKQ